MSFNVDPVAFLTAAAPAQAKSAEPSYEAVIKAVEKN